MSGRRAEFTLFGSDPLDKRIQRFCDRLVRTGDFEYAQEAATPSETDVEELPEMTFHSDGMGSTAVFCDGEFVQGDTEYARRIMEIEAGERP